MDWGRGSVIDVAGTQKPSLFNLVEKTLPVPSLLTPSDLSIPQRQSFEGSGRLLAVASGGASGARMRGG